MYQKDRHQSNQAEYISIQDCSSSKRCKGKPSQFPPLGAED